MSFDSLQGPLDTPGVKIYKIILKKVRNTINTQQTFVENTTSLWPKKEYKNTHFLTDIAVLTENNSFILQVEV